MAVTADQLPDDPDALKAMVLAREVENARLRQIIKELQRHRFGRRAETLPQDQLLLGLEEAEQIEAAGEEAKAQAAPAERQARTAKRRANRGALPAHLLASRWSSTSWITPVLAATTTCTVSAKT